MPNYSIETLEYRLDDDVWWKNLVNELSVEQLQMIGTDGLELVRLARLYHMIHPVAVIFAQGGHFGEAYQKFFSTDYYLPDGIVPAILEGKITTREQMMEHFFQYRENIKSLIGLIDVPEDCEPHIADLYYIQTYIANVVVAYLVNE